MFLIACEALEHEKVQPISVEELQTGILPDGWVRIQMFAKPELENGSKGPVIPSKPVVICDECAKARLMGLNFEPAVDYNRANLAPHELMELLNASKR